MSVRPLEQLLSAADEPFDEYAELILDAARSELAEFGLQRTSLDNVARAAGVSRATLFRRFPNRTALLTAVAAREVQAGISAIDHQLARVEEPEEYVVAATLAVMREIRENELLQRLLVTDRDVFVPMLASDGAILLMGRRYVEAQTEQLAALGARFRGDPSMTAEIMARLVLSVILNPEGFVDLDNEVELERMARGTIVPMVLDVASDR